jgi:hypothetical protein
MSLGDAKEPVAASAAGERVEDARGNKANAMPMLRASPPDDR